uniref:RING-type domain-containing protein n=1 Tax=Panagrolaimus superbus TaxID=310955 RepID=A0A914Z0P6_9BILA
MLLLTRLIWKNRNYGDFRYLCYSMFQWKRLEDGQGPDRIGLLLFDKKSRVFRLILFIVATDNNLISLRDFIIDSSNIHPQRLSYSSHKHGGKLEFIFYERYDQSQPNEQLHFSYIAVDLSTLEILRPKTGSLPSGGNWELPFVAEMKLHFISLERNANKIAQLPMNFLASELNAWIIDPLNPLTEGEQFPRRRAIWCHAWEHGIPFFATARRSTSLSRVLLNLWFIDLRNKRWQKIEPEVQIPFTSQNFAIRAASNNSVTLHFDATETAAFFYKFDVTEPLRNIRIQNNYANENIEKLESPQNSTNFVEVACPICLEMFVDPRTLFCGHSLCFGCLVRLREVGGTKSTDVKCPNCRRVTKIPEAGLPTNYGLQDAISLMLKAQKIRESGFRCFDCKTPGILEEFYVCLNCLDQQLPTKLPESANLCCEKCATKFHYNHSTKDFTFFQNYCTTLKSLKDDCNEEIMKVSENVTQQLQQNIQTFVTDKLVKTAKQIVQNFCEEKVFRSTEELGNQKNEVNETLSTISKRLSQESGPIFAKMLERAILEEDNPELSPRLTDDEVMERLLRI